MGGRCFRDFRGFGKSGRMVFSRFRRSLEGRGNERKIEKKSVILVSSDRWAHNLLM